MSVREFQYQGDRVLYFGVLLVIFEYSFDREHLKSPDWTKDKGDFFGPREFSYFKNNR